MPKCTGRHNLIDTITTGQGTQNNKIRLISVIKQNAQIFNVHSSRVKHVLLYLHRRNTCTHLIIKNMPIIVSKILK